MSDIRGPATPERMEEVRGLFADFLKDRNQRQTPERFKVLDAVYSTGEHFDADTLYIALKSEGEQISRATVYNTLELLTECHLVEKHQFGNKQAKYERAYSFWQHDHLICNDCHELFEFCDPRIQSIQEMVAEFFNFRITHHSLHMYGTCQRDDCPNRNKAAA